MSYPTSLDGEATTVDLGAIDLEAIKRNLYGYGNHIAVQQLIAAVEALRARVPKGDGLPCACRFRGVEGAIWHGSETSVLVDPDEPVQECDLHKALRKRVAELQDTCAGQDIDLQNSGNDNHDLRSEKEVAEAGVAELAEHLDKTIATAADAVNRMNAAEARVAELARQERAQNKLRMQRTAQLEAAEAHMAALAGALEAIKAMEGQDGMTDALFAHTALHLAHTTLAATPEDAMERARMIDILVKAAQKIESVGWQPVGSQHRAEIYFETSDECQVFGHALDIVRGAVSTRLDALGKEGP